MKIEPVILSDNPDELRAFIRSLQAELYTKTLHVEKLKAQLALLRRARFGQSSEKLDREIDQLELMIGDLEEGRREDRRSIATQLSTPPASAGRAGAAGTIHTCAPAVAIHLLRERIEHEVACACPSCGGTDLTMIGTDEREVLEYVPSASRSLFMRARR